MRIIGTSVRGGGVLVDGTGLEHLSGKFDCRFVVDCLGSAIIFLGQDDEKEEGGCARSECNNEMGHAV